MAIVHFRAQIIGGHRSAVAAAAYRHRTTMFDKASDRSWSYTPDAHLVHSEIALPDNAPAWIARLGVAPDVLSAELWNAATLAETRCDAQIAREFVIALPAELTRAQNIQLVRDYVATELSTRGFASDWVYHDNPGNPHVHLMHTMRPLRDSGFGPKATPARDTLGKPLLRANGKPLYTRFAGTPDDYRALRVSWVGHANRALAAAGHSTVLDARSYASRGLDILPSRHLGPVLSALKRANASSIILAEFESDAAIRAKTLAANPGLAVELTAEHLATFTRRDIAKTLATFTTLEHPDFTAILDAALADSDLVVLQPSTNTGLTDAPAPDQIYTTQTQINRELGIIDAVARLANSRHRTAATPNVQSAIRSAAAAIGPNATLTLEQTSGVIHLTRAPRIAALVGIAGTGKSTLLDAARRTWDLEGYTVHGASLAGVATRGLANSSAIPSQTIAMWTRKWDAGKEVLTSKSVLVVDEAGMIGSADMATLVAHVAKSGAKLVLVGDPAQLQPIGAGAPFRAIVETIGCSDLTDVRRQRNPSHALATATAATGNIGSALAAYYAGGHIKTVETTEQAIDTLVRAYLGRRTDPAAAGQSHLALAYTNADVMSLNANIRSALVTTGQITGDSASAPYHTKQGPLAFAPGDRVLCLKTASVTDLDGARHQLDNGSLGTVVTAASGIIKLKLDGGATAKLSPAVYADIAYGYAATVHKSQGSTVDNAYLLVSKHLDRAMTYVAMSRHRHRFEMFVPQSALTGTLSQTLSKAPVHTNAVDAATHFARRRGLPNAAETLSNIITNSKIWLDKLHTTIKDKSIALITAARAWPSQSSLPAGIPAYLPVLAAHLSAHAVPFSEISRIAGKTATKALVASFRPTTTVPEPPASSGPLAARLRAAGLHTLAISATPGGLVITPPPSAVRARELLKSLPHAVEINHRGLLSYQLPAPASPAEQTRLAATLATVDALVSRADTRHAETSVPLADTSITATVVGPYLSLTLPPFACTRFVLDQLQARQTGSDSWLIRRDTRPAKELADNLAALSLLHKTVLIPPTTPSNGLEIPAATMHLLECMTPDDAQMSPSASSVLATLQASLDRYYASEPPGFQAPPAVLEVQHRIDDLISPAEHEHDISLSPQR